MTRLKGDRARVDQGDALDADDDGSANCPPDFEDRFEVNATTTARPGRPRQEDAASLALQQVWRMKRRRLQRSGRQRRQRSR